MCVCVSFFGQLHWVMPADLDQGLCVCLSLVSYTGSCRSTWIKDVCVCFSGQLHWLMPVDLDQGCVCSSGQLHWLMPVDLDQGCVCVPLVSYTGRL